MSVAKEKKENIIADLKKILEKSSVLVFVNFHGLSVAKMQRARAEMKKAGVRFKVAKKTLLNRALETMGFGQMPRMEGEIGIAAGYGDITEPSRILAKFAKENEELKIAGGFYEHAFADVAMMKRLADIPSRETLLGQLAYVLTQPVASLARAINEIAKKGQSD